MAQVALSLLLVVAAGLLVRTFERLARVPLGFDRERVLVVTVPGVSRAGGSLSSPLIFVLNGGDVRP